MPQFDTFSFFSQLFWVFLCFTLLYLSLSYYLLPSIAITLKVRKRKLISQQQSSYSINALSGNSFLQDLALHLEKISQSSLVQSTKGNDTFVQSAKINAYLTENEILKTFSTGLFQKASSATLLQK